MVSSHKTLYYRNSAIFNTIGFIMVVVVNAMAAFSLLNGTSPAEISEKYESLFVPDGLTFSIWSVIYLSLLGFVSYQLWLAFAPNKKPELTLFMERMRGWWLISCLANTCWLFSWHYEQIPLSFLLMLGLLASLLAIHLNFDISLPTQHTTKAEKIFVHIPFSLYLGWICIATVANFAALCVYSGWGATSIPWTIFLILLCTIISTVLIIRRYNFVTGIVAIWALYGIILKRQGEGGEAESPIIIACICAMAVIFLTGIWRWIKRR
jgi:hypothetical protein